QSAVARRPDGGPAGATGSPAAGRSAPLRLSGRPAGEAGRPGCGNLTPSMTPGPDTSDAADSGGASRDLPPAGPRGLTGRAIGGMFWTFSGTGVQAVVQLLAIMALGRLLTPTEFGLMAAANVIVAFSQIVSQIGVGPAI